MNQVIRSYADSLAGATPEEAQRIQTEAEYVSLLLRHDWKHEFSDDHSVWKRGHEEKRRMLELRRVIDPDGALWNLHAPPEQRLMPAAA